MNVKAHEGALGFHQRDAVIQVLHGLGDFYGISHQVGDRGVGLRFLLGGRAESGDANSQPLLVSNPAIPININNDFAIRLPMMVSLRLVIIVTVSVLAEIVLTDSPL